MATWYPASSITPADDNSVQAITGYTNGDKCVCELDNIIRIYKYDSTSTLTDDGDSILAPTDTGVGRWIRQEWDVIVDKNGFADYNGVDRDTVSTISFNDGTRTFSIQPVGNDFKFFVQGEAFYNTGDTVQITDVEGLHWIYFDTDGDLKVQAPGSSTDHLILQKCLVAAIYWDATNNTAIQVLDERHGASMSPATHYHFHETFGAKWESGGALSIDTVDGTGNAAGDAQLQAGTTEIHDEDVEHIVSDGSPQDLAPIAQLPIFYRLGASGDWRKITATDYPVTTTGSGRAAWNEDTGATWQLTEVTNNQFMLMHIFMTNDTSEPIIAIVGQGDYSNISAARNGAETEISSLELGGFPGAEIVALGTLIFQTSNSYSNAVKSRIRSVSGGGDYIDWRSSDLLGGAGGSSNHEALVNLFGGAANDHWHLTQVQHDDLTDGGDTDLHLHNTLDYDTGGGLVPTVFAQDDGITVKHSSSSAPIVDFVNSSDVVIGAVGYAGTSIGLFNSQAGDVYVQASGGGDIYLRPVTGQNGILIQNGGAVTLYHSNSVKLQTNAAGITVSDGTDYANLFATGGNGYFDVPSGGIFYVRDSVSTETMLAATSNGSVDLYYNNIPVLSSYNNAGNYGGLRIYDVPGHGNAVLYLDGSGALTNHLHLRNLSTSAWVYIRGVQSDGTTTVNMGTFDPDGSVDLFYDGTKVFHTVSGGVQLDDSDYLYFGDDQDGDIRYNGADIVHRVVSASNIVFYNKTNGENIARFFPNGACELFYDGSTSLITKPDGVTLSGSSSSTVYPAVLQNKTAASTANYTGIALQAYSSTTLTNTALLLGRFSDTTHATRDSEFVIQNLHAGTVKTMVVTGGDLGRVKLYYQSSMVFKTHGNGFFFGATDEDGSIYQNGVQLGIVSNAPGNEVEIKAQNAADTATNTIFVGEPDSYVGLYYAGVEAIRTTVQNSKYGINIVSGGTTGVKILCGSATPESAVTANVGSIYLRTNGGSGTTLYVKESGTGNTGWVAK